MKVAETLLEKRLPCYYRGFSALDRYFRVRSPFVQLVVKGNLIDLAKIFSGLRYPGREQADAELEEEGRAVYLDCVDAVEDLAPARLGVLDLLYDPEGKKYLDPRNVYPELKARSLTVRGPDGGAAIPDLAAAISRYPFRDLEGEPSFSGPTLDAASQKDLLLQVLTGHHPWRGLKLLMDSGFIAAHWPELQALRDVSHPKEYHPEGDVWDHTIETFRYRKNPDLAVSLALLLHDLGKPTAPSQEGRRFDQHAEIGAVLADRFLRSLGFPAALASDVVFLVKNHMLPGAVKELPLYRTERIMGSDLFPLLLEVYRCDLSSTFRGPGGYYEACKVYQAFLRNRKNPFRKADGKKIQRHEAAALK